MKYTISGFNQQGMIELGLNADDVNILRWFVDFKETGSMVKEYYAEENCFYYWIKYSGLIEALPYIFYECKTEDSQKKKVQRILNGNLSKVLKKKVVKKAAGTYTYFAIIEDQYQKLSGYSTGMKVSYGNEPTGMGMSSATGMNTSNAHWNESVQPKDSSINDSSIINSSNKFDENSTEFQLSLHLYNLVNKNFNIKKPNLQTWATHIDKIIRIDGRSVEEVKRVIDWSQQDDFWKQNIRSTNKLRKHYAQLCMKMNTDKNFQYSKGIEKKNNSSSLNANSTYNYDINSLIEKMKSEV